MWQKLKTHVINAYNCIHSWLEWLQKQFTPDQGVLIAAGTLVSGIAFMELIGAWFAAPFFFIGAILLAFDFNREEPQFKWYPPNADNQLEHIIEMHKGVDYNY